MGNHEENQGVVGRSDLTGGTSDSLSECELAKENLTVVNPCLRVVDFNPGYSYVIYIVLKSSSHCHDHPV